MARLARFVLPGISHHVTQRGNGRQLTFFNDGDNPAYRDLLAVHCAARGVAVWSWMLMPNHVHLILVPEHIDALRGALSKVHRAYAGRIHARERRTGISDRDVSAAWRSTNRTYLQRCAMSRLTRFGHGWLSGPKIGNGQACMRCSIRHAQTG